MLATTIPRTIRQPATGTMKGLLATSPVSDNIANTMGDLLEAAGVERVQRVFCGASTEGGGESFRCSVKLLEEDEVVRAERRA
jgi:hypothetical protein